MATFIYLYIYVMVNIVGKSSAENISSNVCLDRALSFATKYSNNGWQVCGGFSESGALDFVHGGTNACHTACQTNLKCRNKYWNKLVIVSMVFDSYNFSAGTGCSADYEAELLINCSNLRKEQLGIFFNSDCKERDAECSKWYYFCVCHCHPGYIMHYGHCIQAHQKDKTAVTQAENNAKENIGAILGALFGGLFLGLAILTGIGFIIYRRTRFNIQNRTDPRFMFSTKETHNGTRDENTITQDQQLQKKVSPFAPSDESPKYSNSSEQNVTVSVNDDVYNHLNEKYESLDGDTYDHANAKIISGHTNELSDYSNHHGFNEDSAMSGGTENDNYSTLKHI